MIPLYYTDQGCGEPLILLHGNGEDSSYFCHQIAHFSRSYRVIAVDTRGHGKSPRGEGEFSISRFADDLLQLMNELSLDSAHILGFSDGGNIALTFALRHPERVNRLILNGANLDPSGVKASVQLPIVLGYRIASLFAKRSDGARKNAELLGLMVKEPHIDPSRLSSLCMPVLVITGTKDMIRDDHSAMIADSVPLGKWVRIEGDHFVANRNPEAFNHAAEAFLKEEYESHIRCIALDLDRTTLSPSKGISEETLEAIQSAIEKGIHVVVASGRAFASLPQKITELPGIEYAITSNGAAVYHVPSERCIHRTVMTAESVAEILTLTESLNVAYEVFVDGKGYASEAFVRDPVRFGAPPSSIPYIRSTREPVADIRSFIFDHRQEIDALDLAAGSMEERDRIEKILRSKVSDIYTTTSIEYLLEISHRDCGKHAGLSWLLQMLSISPKAVAAFGDGDNDAEMLRFVGTGIAVANATERCKEAADFVTRSNEENGVAFGIRSILKL